MISDQMPHWLWNLILAAIAIILGLLIKWGITRFLSYYAKQKQELLTYSFFRSFVAHLGMPVAYFIPLFFLNLALPLMQMNRLYYDPLDKAVDIFITLAFANLLINGIRVLEDYVFHMYDLNKTDNLKERKIRTQIVFIRKLIIAVIVFITIAIILLSFENMRKIGTGLLTGVGVGGIIVGFAAQNSLGNLLAGFQIAFTQPIRIDDVLVVEGEWGRVEDITLTYVVLRIWDQRRLILPINYFITKPFQNWTRISADILGTVFLYMDYTVPLDKVREEFDRLISDHKLWDGKVKVVQVTDAKDKVIEIRCLMSSRNSSDSFDLRCDIREHMIAYIQKNYPESLPRLRTAFSKSDAPEVITGLEENNVKPQ
ncbi:mechanosensitive ion channel family protein [Mucilaginibacter sp. KACC 22063]|uniref:mechanosensitive ion channel family protein n=1 Tax=Mucilaginibacter sp. KACC 22063 TaxID=3025666 RepID=UPI0023650711|nr:mechanosensitive ion channel domain-containing protein [Mucilaginibacter sp. KACC 22063]WDF53641.1 mechanosensitive ion channel [Mucilaginibacter sp. KACC 22063]